MDRSRSNLIRDMLYVLLFFMIGFLGVLWCDGCVERKPDRSRNVDIDTSAIVSEILEAAYARYDSMMLVRLDSMSRIGVMERTQAQLLMIIWNAFPEYRKLLSPYVKVYSDSLLRHKITVRDTFDFIPAD